MENQPAHLRKHFVLLQEENQWSIVFVSTLLNLDGCRADLVMQRRENKWRDGKIDGFFEVRDNYFKIYIRPEPKSMAASGRKC